MKRLLLVCLFLLIGSSCYAVGLGGGSFIINQDTITATTINGTSGNFTNVTIGGTLTQTGVGTFTAMPILNGGVDVNEDVDIDFDAYDEEFNLTTSSGGTTAAMTIYNSLTDLDVEATLLSLDLKDDADTQGIFLKCRDNSSANTVMSVKENGAITIDVSGAGTGTVLSEATLVANDAAFRIDSETQDLQIGDGTNNTVFSNDGVISQTGTATAGLGATTVTNITVSGSKYGYVDSQNNTNFQVIVSTALVYNVAYPLTIADGKAGAFIVQMGTHTATGTFTAAAAVSMGLSTDDSAGTDAGIGLAVYDGGANTVYIKNKANAADQAATIQCIYKN